MPLPERDFYFLRHGETAWNVAGRFQGHSDIALNEVGLAQAAESGRILAGHPIDLIVASPLIRALKTAAIVAEALERPIRVDSDLRERPFGAFEGLVVSEVRARFGLQPHERLMKHLPEDAEQWHETGARSLRVFGAWLDRYPAKTLLFVAHSGLFDALHEQLIGTRIEPRHAPYFWRHGPGGWRCELV